MQNLSRGAIMEKYEISGRIMEKYFAKSVGTLVVYMHDQIWPLDHYRIPCSSSSPLRIDNVDFRLISPRLTI